MISCWHLGPLHPVEQVLTMVLAFGPFVLLGLDHLDHAQAQQGRRTSSRNKGPSL